ncbi:uncharacterized protein AFUA_5G14700 [Aspergillus fumigatus Af293]|uniref:Uncharacterized protein n=2 Tax=Aspergillus fumigatus TaxID=746128 RepID=Q4WW77_ASPFU|nr:conserved hypothetical protein [Aspergillus fumigatus Af293]EAL91149.1 conserved hypothetical protein [Aspergillus fumigatus Af293]EDP52198.1 conserved hypothetical protein [Aspergillus fumigatus A1163]
MGWLSPILLNGLATPHTDEARHWAGALELGRDYSV